jgi:hypothetical protein
VRPPDDGRRRRRARLGLVLAGGVVMAGGVGVGLVEMLHWPKGSVWAVAAATMLLAGLIRVLTARPR